MKGRGRRRQVGAQPHLAGDGIRKDDGEFQGEVLRRTGLVVV
jgi:hypothetical protein